MVEYQSLQFQRKFIVVSIRRWPWLVISWWTISPPLFSRTGIFRYAPWLSVVNRKASTTSSYGVSQETFQYAFMPVRHYYLGMRYLLGDHYNPFETKIQYELHPTIAIYKRHYRSIKWVCLITPCLIPTSMIYLILILLEWLMNRLVQKEERTYFYSK